MRLLKYPRTPHLEGSRIQPGDEDMDSLPFDDLRGVEVVVEEKVDGANCAVSFSPEGELLLQSRGHFLAGGPREQQFSLLKAWAQRHQDALHAVLGARRVMYGEWVWAKHTVFYDRLPHYFLEFDILDRENDAFLSTDARRALLSGLPVVSVPVLAVRAFRRLEHLTDLVGPSTFKAPGWQGRLRATAEAAGQDAERVLAQTDPSDEMEGLYLKVERDGRVAARYKWVRSGFLQAVSSSGGHWMDRPLLPNQLAEDVDLFAS